MTRFSDQLDFIELGSGILQSESPYYDKHKELTQHMFDKNNWDPNEFIGYRCTMKMPIWRSGICLILDEQ